MLRSDISGNLLFGKIPDSVLLLGSLVYMSVAANQISGSLPSFAGAKVLCTVDVSGNALSGSLPNESAWYGVVRDLNISGNAFIGNVPTALLWSSSVANRSLVASGNQLTGVALGRPVIGTDSFALRSLDLSYNLMSGALPTIFCDGSPFESLVLSDHSLRGTIPGCLAAVAFGFLDLSNNYFIGAVPSAFAQMPSLKFLSLAHNNLDGLLPPQLFSRLQAAVKVDLSQNFQNGTLPFEAITTSQLALFDVTGNCGLVWPNVEDCSIYACLPLCCRIPCSNASRVCNLLPQLPATRCAYARPPAPLDVHASSLGSTGALRVQWLPPPLVHARFCALTYYIAQVVPPRGVAFNISVAAPELEANVPGVPTGVVVLVSVAAVNCAGMGVWSYSTSAVAVSRPGPPSSVVASGLNSGATLAWNAPSFSGLKITSFTLEVTAVGSSNSDLYSVVSTGSCHADHTLTGLNYDALYVFRIRAECSDPNPTYCPSDWSAPTAPVLTYVAPSLIDQLVNENVVVAGACIVALLYCALLLANRKWRDRDFTALFRLAAVVFHVWSSAVMGVKLMNTEAAAVQQVVFFTTLAVAVAWSAARAAAFVRRSLLVPTPPALHTLTFEAWCTKYRAVISSLLFVSCFQLSALGVLRSRAFGPVDGMFSAPLDPMLWSEMQFHATATSLLRAVSTLVIIVVTYKPDDYFMLSVLAGLTSSIGTLGYSLVTLLVDTAVRASGRHRAKQSTSGVHVPLLDASSDVGMEMLPGPASDTALPTLRPLPHGDRGPSEVAIAALCARVGALDAGLASEFRAAIAGVNASHEVAIAAHEAAATDARAAIAAAVSELCAATDQIRELEIALAGRLAPHDVAVQ